MIRRRWFDEMEKNVQKSVLEMKFMKMKRGFIPCFSTHCGMVHLNEFESIGWSDNQVIDFLKVIRCIEFIFGARICKFES